MAFFNKKFDQMDESNKQVSLELKQEMAELKFEMGRIKQANHQLKQILTIKLNQIKEEVNTTMEQYMEEDWNANLDFKKKSIRK